MMVVPAPVLIYAYAYQRDTSSDVAKAYGLDKMDPGGGGTFVFHNVNQHYRSPSFSRPQARTGRIALQVVRREGDGGLVLRIAEPFVGPNVPAEAQTCVVFADTTFVCDPSRSLSPEAATLLHFLGRGFVDAARLDARRHWHVAPQGDDATPADYTVAGVQGSTLKIVGSAIESARGEPGKTLVSDTIEYDTARALPLSVEELTQRRATGGVVAEIVNTQTTLQLQP